MQRHSTPVRSSASGLITGLLIPLACTLPTAGFAQTLSKVQQASVINLGFVPDQPPFSSTSADGKPNGYAIELCGHVVDTLKERLGLTGLKVNHISTDPIAGLQRVERGEIDLLCAAIPETLRTREHVSFSIPIYVTGVGALVRRDASPTLLRVLNGQVAHTGPTWRATINQGLANQVYAVHTGTTSAALVRERISALRVISKVVPVETYEEGVALVAQKKADAFFADRVVLTTYAARQGNAGLMMIDRRFTLEPIALAMRRADEDFRLVVDTALSELYRSGNIVPTYSRYFGEPTETARLLLQAYSLP